MQEKTKNRWRFDPDDLSPRAAIVIALAFFLVCAIFMPLGHDAYVKWGGLSLYTAGVFGFFLNSSKRYLRTLKFWKLTSLLLVAHLAGWIVLLTHLDRWGLLWFSPMVMELPIFWYLRDWPGRISS